jgi:hypothetical protein
LAIAPRKTPPAPITWMTGMPNERSDPTSVIMYPDRRSASTRVPYSETARMGTETRVEPPASGADPGVESIARQGNVTNRIESSDATINTTLCFIG